ncbi:ABC transporter ATP-binding protein/permease [Planctomycetota bacterium]|nr:ABC transporter ATP-binding protein/permease [Planctomycetota bacterium]
MGLGILTAGSELLLLFGLDAFLSALNAKAPASAGGLTGLLLDPLDSIFGSKVASAGVFVSVAALLTNGLRITSLWVSMIVSNRIGAQLSAGLFRRIVSKPYLYFAQVPSGEILAATNKVAGLANGVLFPLCNLSTALFSVGVLGTAILSVSFEFAMLAILSLAAAYILVALRARRSIKRNSRLIAKLRTEKNGLVIESIGGIRDVILDNRQELLGNTFLALDLRQRMRVVRNHLWVQLPRFFLEAFAIIAIVGAALFSLREGSQEAMTLESLSFLGAASLRLLPNMQRFYQAWGQVTNETGNVEDAIAVLRSNTAVDGAEQPGNVDRERALDAYSRLRLVDVAFRYPSADEDVFSEVNVVIERRACVGILGPTGGGKSTLVDLLLGLIQPTTGQVLLGDESLEGDLRFDWRACLAHVPQDIFLVDGSFTENIALGEDARDVDLDRVKEASRMACAIDFINASPKGFDSPVGERGVQLSGGERQRIGIARALYSGAPILVLDEATSALDDETERRLMNNVRESSSDLTLIMIAHRLNTLKGCDQLLRVRSGSVEALASLDEVTAGDREEAVGFTSSASSGPDRVKGGGAE